MRLSTLARILALAATVAAGAAEPGATPPATPATARHPAPLPPLRFQKMPLGYVVRIISARMRAPISIAANAAAPVSGDFSHLDPRGALEAAARQAGLVVVPLGKAGSAGFSLIKPPPPAPPNPAANRQALAAAARRREALLRQQAALLQEAAGGAQ